jgi:energy-coupling factor transporter transmembrane protein EcfT
MDHTFFYAIVAGVALVLIVFAARFAIRWIIRVAIIGLLLLVVLGGTAWWWFHQSVSQSNPQPRPTTTRRATADRR